MKNGDLTLKLLPLRFYIKMRELLYSLAFKFGNYDVELSNFEPGL